MKRVFLLSVCASVLGVVAHAANITFVGENGSGSGNLSEDTNWNGNTKPGTSDTAVFDTSGTLTSSTLFSPNGYTFKGTGLTWTIGSANLGTSQSGAADVFTLGSGSQTDNLAGNTLILASGANIELPDAGFTIGKSSKAVTTGSNGGNTLRIENGARLWVGRAFSLGGADSPTNRLIVAAGGVLDITRTQNNFQTMAFGASSYGNTADIYGTCVSTQNYEYVSVGQGAAASNNVLVCHSGSHFETKGNVYVGYSGSHNTFRVADGATVKQSNATSRKVEIGHDAQSCDNRLIVENGNDLSFAAPTVVGEGGSDNLLLVSNGTAAVKATIGNQASATGNVFKWAGDSCLSNVDLDSVAFGSGSNNKFIIDGLALTCIVSKANFAYKTGSGNKAILRNAKLTTCGQLSSTMANGNELVLDNSEWNHVVSGHARSFLNQNCTLTLVNNTIANFNRDSFYFGNTAAGARNNLNILSGSTANFNTFRLQMDNNRVVISNATMTVNHGESSSYYLPFYNGSSYTSGYTNNTFRFEGSSPSLEITAKDVRFSRHLTDDKVDFGVTTLEYSLPAEAYATAPLRTSRILISRSNKVRVELNGEQARTQRYTLAETSTGTISVDDMDELGSELPSNCRLYLSDDSKKLILKASVPCGMVISFR